MVKLIHMSDTHLGYRARKGAINQWAIENYSKPYEQEIYDLFIKLFDDIANMKDLDFVIHCGDMFHVPSKLNAHPPPEPARMALKSALDNFFNKTSNKIPLIYIEGNHGIFRGYDYTPFESHISREEYPNLHYYKERDLLNAIKSDQPLFLEFKEKRVRFYLFPYFEFKSIESYKHAYDKWIEKQKPPKNDNFINIALAHGSEIDNTLHKELKYDDFGYDYIALGHEHGLIRKSKKSYYSGCLLPLNFKEIHENQGYLIVDINDETKELKVKEEYTDQMIARLFDIITINVSPQETSEELERKINRELKKCVSNDGFNPKTAARLKINFTGEMTFEKVWQINDIMVRIRRECFSQTEKYNIMQLLWKTSDFSEFIEDDISPGIIEDYILEEPDEEFKQFVIEKLSDDKSQFNVDKLTRFGMSAIKKALSVMDKEEEV
ncbi:MAG: exonuclease SbcCD subunit D [Promethearchaeota archaeon]